jgi:hypothetical protein
VGKKLERYWGQREIVETDSSSLAQSRILLTPRVPYPSPSALGTYHVKGESDMNSRASSFVSAALMAIFLTCAAPLFAGPPLICHVVEIGPAQTLPWVGLNYQKGDGSYNLQNLARDTIAILDSNPSVLVRMETLRRATLYARQDSQAAKELLTRLRARATEAPIDSRGALAWFDFGYLAESYKQWIGKNEPNPAAGVDGYGWVKKAIQQRGDDPEMEFAAALITLTAPNGDYRGHVQKALTGAKTDALLAQNLASRFGSESISGILTAQSSKR